MPESDQWKPSLYDDKHSFVWKLADSLVDLLAPKAGERILDLGCSTGQLTADIASSGADVLGIDNSVAMIDEARRLHPALNFRVADAHDFEVNSPIDAVFSNAALHWISKPDEVVSCISRALKTQGRLTIEFGGNGNVTNLTAAIQSASERFLGKPLHHLWYFPSISEFSTLLESYGLEVTQAALIDRPTPLEGPDGLRNWVRMFGHHWLEKIPEKEHPRFLDQVEEAARKTLFHDSVWYADYRRIRVQAQKE